MSGAVQAQCRCGDSPRSFVIMQRRTAYRPIVHVAAGLRQAALMLLVAGLAAVALASVWVAAQGGVLQHRLAVVLMVVAGLVSLTGGTELSRLTTHRARGFLGSGPDREEPSTGRSLTGVGVFLFVSLPLFLAGGLLLPRDLE